VVCSRSGYFGRLVPLRPAEGLQNELNPAGDPQFFETPEDVVPDRVFPEVELAGAWAAAQSAPGRPAFDFARPHQFLEGLVRGHARNDG
jgi:hypothetical protein